MKCICILFLLFVQCLTEEQLIRKYVNGESQKKVHPSLRIINGQQVKINKYPFMSSLKVFGDLFGSAAIIDKQWILTTAFTVSWFQPDDLELRVGVNRYDNGGQILDIHKIFLHEMYNRSWDNNIALLKVAPIKFSKKINKVNLPTKEFTGKGYVAGWGETKEGAPPEPSPILVATEVTFLDWTECNKTYTPELTPRLLCTFDSTQGPCVYDAGDPLVVNGTVYGLYAGGKNCTPNTYPQLYTNVLSFVDWIHDVMSKN